LLTLRQFAVKLLAVTLVAFCALGAAGVGAGVAVAVGVGVGVGLAAGNWNLPMRVNQLALLVAG